MANITLEISDELASRLAPFQNRLSQVMTFCLDWMGHSEDPLPSVTASQSVLTEMINFLASGPSQKNIVEFKVSQQAQSRLETLLDLNRQGSLTPYEKSELDSFQYVNHLMILLKARARVALMPAKEYVDGDRHLSHPQILNI